MKYVCKQSGPSLWTVGFYDPQGHWNPESDWPSPEDAAKRIDFLNWSEQ